MAANYLRSSRVISILTLLSRITGLVRDVILTAWLGRTWVHDSFRYAFAIPHMFRRLFGEGALSAAFIPVLSENLSKQGKGRAEKIFANVATLLAMILIALTTIVLLIVGAVWLIGDGGAKRNLLLGLTALMTPYMIFVCLVAFFSALMNCFERFALPAFMPILLNIFQITAVFVAKYVAGRWTDRVETQIYVLGIAVVLAGVVQLAMMIAAVRRLGIRWRIDASLSDPDLRRMMVMLAPMVMGLGVLQFGAWFDNQVIVTLSGKAGQTFHVFGREVAYPLKEGSLTAVDLARRLYNFPLGVLAISLATAAFPMFSRYAAGNDTAKLTGAVSHALRIAVFEGLPCGVGMIILAELIVRVVFERGNFDRSDSLQTAHILRMYSLGLWAYFAQHVMLRAFYSLKDMYTPLKVMIVTLIINVALNLTLLWVPALRAGAFGLSTSIMCSINVIVLGIIFSRRMGRLHVRAVLVSAGRTLVVCAVMAVGIYLCYRYVYTWNKYLALMVCMVVGVVIFAVGGIVSRAPELKDILGRSKPADF